MRLLIRANFFRSSRDSSRAEKSFPRHAQYLVLPDQVVAWITGV